MGGRRGSSKRRTDYGTVILHGCLVAALAVMTLSGLRIASESPGRAWVNAFDLILPSRFVWTSHMQAAVALVTVAIAYPIYLARAGLWGRVRFDRIRLSGLFGRHPMRWGAINVALYWIFYIALLSEIVTGTLMYFDRGNNLTISLHWSGMWIIGGWMIAHVLAHWKIGGVLQLLRIVRPSRLLPQPPRFDPADLLELLDQPASRLSDLQHSRMRRREAEFDRPGARQQFAPAGDQYQSMWSARAGAERFPSPQSRAAPRAVRPRRGGPVIQSNPFVAALAAAIAATSLMVTIELETSETLLIRHVDASDIPVIDGDTSDRVWRTAKPVYVLTGQGGNFDGKGETIVEIRAVHDGQWAYFLFAWDDPTRSLKQLPLVKTPDGWKLLHEGYEAGEEHAYSEDKFAVLLTKLDVILAGDRTFHASAKPLDGKPGTISGRGLHYTGQPNLFVDVWEWKATSTGSAGFMDDDHFGPPVEPTPAQAEGKMPYRGGFSADPGTANYSDNFAVDDPQDYRKVVRPLRLPKDIIAMTRALGDIDLDSNHGESIDARWYMTEIESVPYSRELDSRIPLGAVVPGVIVSGAYSGDRADVRCAARWAAGRWALEVQRRLDTGSPYDVPIGTGTFMRVAAFDHTQISHTRHVHPIRLEVE
ncbi:MAG TPA: ethylbenzene dehydrogenase-related protein [Pseudolabrys sp.]|nr:ethylbenzene dehydrogenase-related protein [Pseudolabrys sp.]